MKKIIKIIYVLILVLFFISFNYHVKATSSNYDIGAFDGESSDTTVKNTINGFTGSVIGAARIVAAGIAATILLVIAIKYMSAAPQGKAEIKRYAIAYFIGVFVLFSAKGIFNIVAGLAESLN